MAVELLLLYPGCFHIQIFRNSLITSFDVSCQNHSCPALYIFWEGRVFFWFTAFNIVTNIVYKSINFAMCQFMRFSATHFMYSLIIHERMRTEMRVSNSQVTWHLFVSPKHCLKTESREKNWILRSLRLHCCPYAYIWIWASPSTQRAENSVFSC